MDLLYFPPSVMEMEINCWIQIFFNKTFYTNQNFVEVINERHLKLCSNSHSRSIVKVTIPMYILQAGLNLKEAWQAFVSVCKSPVVCLKLLLQFQLCWMQLVTVLLIWRERQIFIGNQAENYSNGKLCANDSHSRCAVNVNFEHLSCFYNANCVLCNTTDCSQMTRLYFIFKLPARSKLSLVEMNF